MIELKDVEITHVSLVDKAANLTKFFLMKSELNLKKTIEFIKSEDFTKVYGVVYEPDKLDSQGHSMNEEEITKASAYFMKGDQSIDLNHDFKTNAGMLVENAIALQDMEVGSDIIKKGTWYIAVEPSEEAKALIKSGELTGFSMAGKAELIQKAGAELNAENRNMLQQLFDWLKSKLEVQKSDESIQMVEGEVEIKVNPIVDGEDSIDVEVEQDPVDYGLEFDKVLNNESLSDLEKLAQCKAIMLEVIKNKKEV